MNHKFREAFSFREGQQKDEASSYERSLIYIATVHSKLIGAGCSAAGEKACVSLHIAVWQDCM